jgi:uncharacterized membrane protein
MLIKLIIEFLFFSFIGWILDSVYRTIIDKRIVNAGYFRNLPICPIYGFGALSLIYFIELTQGMDILVRAIIFMIVLDLVEYIGAIFSEKILNVKLWDYSDLKLNLQGRICLMHSIFWVILSLLFTYYMYPATKQIFDNIDTIKMLANIDTIIFLLTILIAVAMVARRNKKVMETLAKTKKKFLKLP